MTKAKPWPPKIRGDQPLVIFDGKIYRRFRLDLRFDPPTFCHNPLGLIDAHPPSSAELTWTRGQHPNMLARITNVQVDDIITVHTTRHGRRIYEITGKVEDITEWVHINPPDELMQIYLSRERARLYQGKWSYPS